MMTGWATAASAQDHVQIQFTETRTSFPRYTPKHVVAVWIVNSSGSFVRTLMRYGQRRVGYLRDWNSVSQDRDIIGSLPDVITGATVRNLTTRTIDWDLTDVSGNIVPDDTYTIRMELTDHNASSASENNLGFFTFEKNGIASSQTGLSSGGFNNVSVNYFSAEPPPPTGEDPVPGDPDAGPSATTCGLVAACIDDDGCCHPDCVYEVDNDCAPDSSRNDIAAGCSTGGTSGGGIGLLLVLALLAWRRRSSHSA